MRLVADDANAAYCESVPHANAREYAPQDHQILPHPAWPRSRGRRPTFLGRCLRFGLL